MTDHCIPGVERPACFEIVPTARAVSGAGKKRRSRFVTRQSIRTAFATVAREDAWSMRTVPDLHQGRTRSDLLFTMSNNTRPPGEPGRTRIFSILDERTPGCQAAICSQAPHPKHPLGGVAAAANALRRSSLGPQAEQKRMPTEAVKTA